VCVLVRCLRCLHAIMVPGESTFWWIDFSFRALWWIEFSLRALWWIMPPERFHEHALPRIWGQ
jgi:hypothetical protein